MKNIKVDVQNGVMTLQIDLSKDFGASKSGKNKIIATTGGNQAVIAGDKEVFIGVNVYKEV